MAKRDASPSTERRTYWGDQIAKARKRFRTFHDNGEHVVDQYRLQKADGNDAYQKDKFNILYSSTETIRPNLYAQTPKVMVELRHRDRASQTARDAVNLLNAALGYVTDEQVIDEVMDAVVEDYLLPGMGCAWVLYEPIFKDMQDADGKPIMGDNGEPQQELYADDIGFEYIYWKDFLVGDTRGWRKNPWVAKRLWLTKDKAAKYFGREKANKLSYNTRRDDGREVETVDDVAEVWEIWDKTSKKVYWYSDGFAGDLIDVKDDPLRLKRFFPCPRPLRAIYNNRTFVPRALYSQYKSQAETMNVMTRRIRLLAEALKVVGVFNAANEKLADVLNPHTGNKMIAVDSWAMFAQAGGIKGNIEWVPLDAVVTALVQLQQARETAKQEIYEITGFSDIVRGVSKASETLGAQNIKQNWAGARVKKMQREVQRFARDLIAIAGEIMSEHLSEETFIEYAGIDIPSQEQMQTPEGQQMFAAFKAALQMLRQEGRRCAQVDIETDSTILADEEAERKDRMDFLGAAGAFLQQAVPAMQTMPQMGPLLGAMLMFTIRTFPSSRPIESVFQQVEQQLANWQPPQEGDNGAGEKAKADGAVQTAQITQQTEQQRIEADNNTAQMEMQAKERIENAKIEADRFAEQNRHDEKMAEIALKQRELELREREVAVKEAELGIKQDAQALNEQTAAHEAHIAEEAHELNAQTAAHSASMAEASNQREYDKMDRDDANREQDRLTGPNE